MAGLSDVITVLSALGQHCDNVKAYKNTCADLNKDHVAATEGQETPGWVPDLAESLKGATECVVACREKPLMAKINPTYYTRKLEKGRQGIRDAMEAIAISTATTSVLAQKGITDLAQDFKRMEKSLATAQRDNEKLVNQMEKAFKGGKSAKADDFMQNLAHEHGLSDANAAYRQLAEADEFHRAQLKEVKDASSQRELELAISLSKMAVTLMDDFPENFKDPISHGMMVDPVMLAWSGNTYDRTSIGLALVHKPGVDPLTNIKYEGEAQLIPNRALKGAIEEWKQRQLAQPAPAPRSEAKEADNFKDAENRVLKKRQAEMEEDSMLDRVERGGGGGGESGATLDLEAALKAHSEAQLTQKRLEKKGFAVGSRVTWTKETPTSRRGR